jgi:hypothetical protein
MASVTEELASAVNDGVRASSSAALTRTRRAGARAVCADEVHGFSPPPPGVADVFNNQRVIEAEARELQARAPARASPCGTPPASFALTPPRVSCAQTQAVQFAKQTGRWISMVNDFDKALKARMQHTQRTLAIPPARVRVFRAVADPSIRSLLFAGGWRL